MTITNKIPLEEKFRILSRLSRDFIESQIFRKIDLTYNQFLIIKILYSSGGMSIHQIASLLSISRAAASKNTSTLVSKRLVCRHESDKDRRYFDLSLSKKGAKLIHDYHTYCDGKIKDIFSHFTKNEREIFHQLLDKYIYYCINDEKNLSLFCMQCGGTYEGNCMIGSIKHQCFFKIKNDRKKMNHV